VQTLDCLCLSSIFPVFPVLQSMMSLVGSTRLLSKKRLSALLGGCYSSHMQIKGKQSLVCCGLQLILHGQRPHAYLRGNNRWRIKPLHQEPALHICQAPLAHGIQTGIVSHAVPFTPAAMLAYEDRPADLLNVLRAMVTSNQRLPRSAKRPREDAGGLCADLSRSVCKFLMLARKCDVSAHSQCKAAL
jgi:hypothetical protein